MTFQAWKIKFLNSMIFQVFHDPYEPYLLHIVNWNDYNNGRFQVKGASASKELHLKLSLHLSNRKRFPCLHSLIIHERGWESSRQLCKPETKLRVCITVENSPYPSSVYIRQWKHRKKVFYCFYKITSSKKLQREKRWKKNSFYWSKRIFLQH